MPTTLPARELFSTLVHEAGHAVIGRVLAIPSYGMAVGTEIAMRDGGTGYSLHATYRQTWQAWRARGSRHGFASVLRVHILMLMAGHEAERSIYPEFAASGDSQDRRRIAVLLNKLYALGEPVSEARMRQFARAFVRRHRGLILKVGLEMLRLPHLYMTPEELDRVIYGP